MNHTSDYLKDCPICKSDWRALDTYTLSMGAGQISWVMCDNCEHEGEHMDTVAEAWEVWNES